MMRIVLDKEILFQQKQRATIMISSRDGYIFIAIGMAV